MNPPARWPLEPASPGRYSRRGPERGRPEGTPPRRPDGRLWGPGATVGKDTKGLNKGPTMLPAGYRTVLAVLAVVGIRLAAGDREREILVLARRSVGWNWSQAPGTTAVCCVP